MKVSDMTVIYVTHCLDAKKPAFELDSVCSVSEKCKITETLLVVS